jgi:hypothetical protein
MALIPRRPGLHPLVSHIPMNVSQIYDGDGGPVEMKIELEKEAAG